MEFEIKELKAFVFTSTFMYETGKLHTSFNISYTFPISSQSCYLTCWAAVLLVKLKFAIAYFCWRHIISAMLDRHSFVNLPSVYFDACDFIFSLNSLSQWCYFSCIKKKVTVPFSSSLSLPSLTQPTLSRWLRRSTAARLTAWSPISTARPLSLMWLPSPWRSNWYQASLF